MKKFDMLCKKIVLFSGCKKMTPAYALPWDFQAKTFDYRETIWGVYQDDDKIFRKSKNAVQQPSHSLEKVTVKSRPDEMNFWTKPYLQMT